MKLRYTHLLLSLLSVFLWTKAFSAPVAYSGKLAVNGINLDGTASLSFALRDANGTVHWRNGNDANATIAVPVDRGHYLVLLGGQGMNPLPADLFLDHPELYLQVRIGLSGNSSLLHLTPDRRITASPHALSAEVARNALVADLAKAVQSGAVTKEMLAPSVLADLNATITRSRLAAEVLVDLNRTITRTMLPADVLSDLNGTISHSRLGADVLADLNATITRSRLAADVLADLNGTITRTRLAADIVDDLNRTSSIIGTSSDNFNAGLRAYLRPMIDSGIRTTTGVEGARATLLAPEVEGRFLRYQWSRNGQEINGADGPEYVIEEFNASRDSGNYVVKISNAFATLHTKAILRSSYSPLMISTGSAWSSNLLVKSDGSLWGIGTHYGIRTENIFFPGDSPPGGVDGNPTNLTSSLKLADGNVTAISASGDTTLFVKSDGSLWGWGNNYSGQLGLGAKSQHQTLTKIVDSNVSAVSIGQSHSFFIKTDGSLWGMGSNDEGQLGDGTTTSQLSPKKIADANVTAVSVGSRHSLFIKNDGSLWGMGANWSGQIGTGNTTSPQTPVKVVDGNVTAVSTSSDHSLFIKNDGSLWAMGSNYRGQLGDGNTTNRQTPVKVVDGNVTAVSGGMQHSLFIKSDGSLWGMGSNAEGQLGLGVPSNGSAEFETSPKKVVDGNVTAVSISNSLSFFIKSDQTLWAMGPDYNGLLRADSNASTYSPYMVNLVTVIEKPFVPESAVEVTDPEQ